MSPKFVAPAGRSVRHRRFRESKTEAEYALRLDEINRKNGHTDRYLPDSTVVQLRRLAAGSAK